MTVNNSNPTVRIAVQLGPNVKRFDGRLAWAIDTLIENPDGITTAQLPAGVRWSHFVWQLRRQGFVIESDNVRHSGPFSGRHCRYSLKSPVNVIERRRQMEMAAA